MFFTAIQKMVGTAKHKAGNYLNKTLAVLCNLKFIDGCFVCLFVVFLRRFFSLQNVSCHTAFRTSPFLGANICCRTVFSGILQLRCTLSSIQYSFNWQCSQWMLAHISVHRIIFKPFKFNEICVQRSKRFLFGHRHGQIYRSSSNRLA